MNNYVHKWDTYDLLLFTSTYLIFGILSLYGFSIGYTLYIKKFDVIWLIWCIFFGIASIMCIIMSYIQSKKILKWIKEQKSELNKKSES